MKKVSLALIIVVLTIAAISIGPNISQAQTTSEWKYAKSGWFGWDSEEEQLFYQEDCTSDAGSQCTAPSGSFRTYIDILSFIKAK